ncbi:CRISPR system precrRNA processing endoribonuclease RAMP protein Cas6 [Dissulfurispira sp.]|uniref:CRISPR system precrRNA processing endoribonuclease RAMP protein Cas6 n=1 Tax=Dissulfurispira sp. TaxID=2817609 RepID=UPI002FD8DA19
MMTADITAGRFEFCVVPRDPLILPSYKGSTFRGAFGHAFKRVVCALKAKECSGCLLKEKCVYSYVFETPPPPDTKMMRKYVAAPHPFIIEPPLEKRMSYKPADEITFGLVLVGRAIDYLAYFIYAFSELGSIGIGRGKGSFELKNVSSNGRIIYDSQSKTIHSFKANDIPLFFDDSSGKSEIENVTIRFLTPTRIFYNNHLTKDLEFHILVRNLLRRLSLLYYFHCGGDPSDWDFKGLIKKSEDVVVAKRNLRWYDWERYSARQNTKMKMGGFVGEITFNGDVEQLMPLIKAGEIVHVGKGTTFGLGKYEVLI